MIHILVVDDDPELNRAVCTYLNDSGFTATGCLGGNDACQEMYNKHYDLIISDIMMPGVDGFEFARAVRRVNGHIPILFMSARDDMPAMRVRALLRRANIEATHKLTHGNLVLDADAVSAVVDGQEVPVTMREFNILFKLLSYPNKTFTRAQLMDEFWSMESESTLRAVDVYITKLRDKFSGCTGFSIATVRGLGYKAVLK